MSDHIHMCLSIPPKSSVAHTIGFLKGKSAGHSLDRTGPEKPAQAGSKKRPENVAHIGGRGNGWVVMNYAEILRNERLEPEALIQPLILRET